MPRSPAISFKLFQNSSSRLTLVLWPAMTIERSETEDFMSSPPAETIPCFNRCANNFNLWPEQHSQRQATQVISGSLSGDRGKTAAAAEGPWSDPCEPELQGLSQSSPSRISQTDPALAHYTVSDGSGFDRNASLS